MFADELRVLFQELVPNLMSFGLSKVTIDGFIPVPWTEADEGTSAYKWCEAGKGPGKLKKEKETISVFEWRKASHFV